MLIPGGFLLKFVSKIKTPGHCTGSVPLAGRRGAEGSWERDSTLQHWQWAGPRSSSLPLFPCPALPGVFFKPLVLMGTSGAHCSSGQAESRTRNDGSGWKVSGRLSGASDNLATNKIQISLSLLIL